MTPYNIRESNRRKIRDFVCLFNALWYKDFPILPAAGEVSRANWTTHIASTIKQCSDLLGFFIRFETGNRTDAVIEKATYISPRGPKVSNANSDDEGPSPNRKIWAKVEWEWKQIVNIQDGKGNEINKLATAASQDEADFYVFVGYSKPKELQKSLQSIKNKWDGIEDSLLAIIIEYEFSRYRKFRIIRTYEFKKDNEPRLMRQQHALPWEVPDSRWQAAAQNGRPAN